MLKNLFIVLAAANLTACAALGDPRDAPWDPRPGQALHDQLPNWQNQAMRHCGGHLRADQRLPGMTDRC